MRKLAVALVGLLVTFGASVAARQTSTRTKRFLLSPAETALQQQLERQMKTFGRRATFDPRIAHAARIYASGLAEIDELPSGFIYENFLHHAMHRAGLADPHPVTIELSLGRLEHPRTAELIKSVLRRWSPTHYGLALVDKPTRNGRRGKRFTVIFVARHCGVRIPSGTLKRGTSLALEAELDPSWQLPRLYVMTPQGRVHSYPMTRRFRRALAPSLRLRKEGRYLFEIMASNQNGPSVLALFPVHVGELIPPLVRYPVLDRTAKRPTPSQAETRIVKLINLDRKRYGLQPLLVHVALRRVAREHSKDMLQHRYFAHNSPRSGNLRTRLEHAGIRFTLSRENISTGSSLQQLHDRLMESPSHRVNVLDPAVTHLGVGISILELGARRLYIVTENFARLRHE